VEADLGAEKSSGASHIPYPTSYYCLAYLIHRYLQAILYIILTKYLLASY
jgi:hypothetical protein